MGDTGAVINPRRMARTDLWSGLPPSLGQNDDVMGQLLISYTVNELE